MTQRNKYHAAGVFKGTLSHGDMRRVSRDSLGDDLEVNER